VNVKDSAHASAPWLAKKCNRGNIISCNRIKK
jgi:hypothetical protein